MLWHTGFQAEQAADSGSDGVNAAEGPPCGPRLPEPTHRQPLHNHGEDECMSTHSMPPLQDLCYINYQDLHSKLQCKPSCLLPLLLHGTCLTSWKVSLTAAQDD